jgi:hypothetical protein
MFNIKVYHRFYLPVDNRGERAILTRSSLFDFMTSNKKKRHFLWKASTHIVSVSLLQLRRKCCKSETLTMLHICNVIRRNAGIEHRADLAWKLLIGKIGSSHPASSADIDVTS